eukprot:CAMPEP_0114241088 /NCGR_PEP_ID=MMETSP0058-20121206/9451_1 /TAXON_ID=36894 /ORGANISM="Pyramimonas parkeae, CCMP726" /LENGTH=252 /DNA_ID=CAMNT_0001353601 /DNA_START=76 /DNA_END=834 /DNA_ORIENTATION=-
MVGANRRFFPNLAKLAPLFSSFKPSVATWDAFQGLRRACSKHNPQATCKQAGRRGLSSATCPSCSSHAQSGLFFCPSCDSILPVEKEALPDYFSLLGIDKMYTVDVAALELKFKNLQRVLHPDKFATASKETRASSEYLSAYLNKAVGVLRSPLQRALYMLELRGIHLVEGSAGLIDDPELLQTVMETRMDVESAVGDEELLSLKISNQARLRESELTIAKAIAADDLNAAKQEVIRMTYWTKIDEVISAKS